ncbi:MAG TPA: DUF167 domain-containing protein [Chlamydiales bacterium]|nr:DUF167 domain-containing protein [Chlamydiales bacterium]
MILKVSVSPNARESKIVGFQDDVLRVRIHAPPDKGKANETLIEFLSETFSIPKSKIHILSGHTSRLKKLEIEGEINLSSLKNVSI